MLTEPFLNSESKRCLQFKQTTDHQTTATNSSCNTSQEHVTMVLFTAFTEYTSVFLVGNRSQDWVTYSSLCSALADNVHTELNCVGGYFLRDQ